MAGLTSRREPGIDIIYVACSTKRAGMGAAQLKLGGGAMVETNGCPPVGRMAVLAILGKPCTRVVGIARAAVITRMTADAGRRRSRIVVVSVARRAVQLCMRAGQ